MRQCIRRAQPCVAAFVGGKEQLDGQLGQRDVLRSAEGRQSREEGQLLTADVESQRDEQLGFLESGFATAISQLLDVWVVVDFVGEHMNKHQVKWKVVETPVDVYYCGLGVAKNATGLKDWLNVAIFGLHKRGKVSEIWKKWFGIDMLYPTGVGAAF